MNSNTIAAIATAMSPAGISIVRMSGEDAFSIIDKVYHSKNGQKKLSNQKANTIHYGFICDGEEMIDEVLVLLMRGPHSFTAEDTVEIDCHGGVLVTKRILEVLIKHGAVPAEPGEFTKRAFLNGRIDLSKAEAVMDVIHAKNQFALKSSVSQLRGSVAAKIKDFRDQILDSIAFIEAALDDPEHIEIDGYAEELLAKIEPMKAEMDELILRADNGRMLSEGIKTAILGKPNAGKSSLLNLFAGRERAIVTEIAGTTRDALEEQVRIGDICFEMIDTAGIRSTEDIVEKIGVEKAKKVAQEADLILYVIDSSIPLDENDIQIMEFIKNRKSIVVLNKSDLVPVVTEQDILAKCETSRILSLSALTGSGHKELEDILKEMFYAGEVSANDQVHITNIRHKKALTDASESLTMVCSSIRDEMPEDFYTIDLMNAYTELGKILGEEVEEDLVNRIFEKFCMGK